MKMPMNKKQKPVKQYKSCLTSVSSQGLRKKFCKILTIASFMLMKANLMPMQFLGPCSKGRYV